MSKGVPDDVPDSNQISRWRRDLVQLLVHFYKTPL